MIIDILKHAIKDGKLLLIWLLIVCLNSAFLSLSSDNFLLSLFDSISKEWLIKTSMILLLISLGLIVSLFILHKKQKVKINSQTCDWLPDPGVWKHKTNGIQFCAACHSPLSSELYCAKCNRGYGKGEVFTVDW